MKPPRARGRAFALASALAAAVCLPAAFPGCDGGTSSETVGLVEVRPGSSGLAGRTAPGIPVGLYSLDYLPLSDSGFASVAVADSAGRFAFENVLPGRYRILARKEAGLAALIPEIGMPGEPGEVYRAALEPTGTLSGTLTDSLPAFLGFVYVPGTPLFAAADSLMRYSLPGLPAGTYPVVKMWKRNLPCDPDKACGGVESRRDSAEVRIRPGQDAAW